MTSNSILYFAYGANLDKIGMGTRCPGCEPYCIATLPDHRLVFRGVADLESKLGKSVEGALYWISAQHLRALDRFEGYPRLYIRRQVQVITADKETLTATVYQMTEPREYEPPFRIYLNTILDGCHQWGMPMTYIRTVICAANNQRQKEL